MRSSGEGCALPPDTGARMTALGGYELDPVGSGENGQSIQLMCVSPYGNIARNDPAGFLRQLRETVANADGLARYGAACCAAEHLGSRNRNPDFLALLDAAIAYKRALGLSSDQLKAHEWDRWVAVHGPRTW